MKLSYHIFWAIFLLLLQSSCEKAQLLSETNVLLEFKLEAVHNEGILQEDIVAIIERENILLSIPPFVKTTDLVATFIHNGKNVYVNGVLQISTVTSNDFSKSLVYEVVAENGNIAKYALKVDVNWISDIPHLFIITEGNAPVNTKDYYLQGTLTIDGKGIYEDYNGTTGIRGRGNTTWTKPKKPYRLKLDKKASLLGLKEEKDWVLLANYLDETLMLNAVAMKIGQQLEMPYTNNIIPVDLTINGNYLGNYMLTEQIEVSKTRIDIEDGGVLLEMDIYFDEDYRFRSDNYRLPVMVKYPKLKDYAPQEADHELKLIKNDFQILENAVSSANFPHNDYLDYIDAEALVNYFVVYDLTRNFEINHPKSTFLYKPKDQKYMMGPIWDFDWAFSYNGSNSHFHDPNKPLFSDNSSFIGTKFFGRFMEDPKIKDMYAKKWDLYKSNHLPILLEYIDGYATLIKDSQKKDFELWKVGSKDFEKDVQKLKTWLEERAEYIDSYVSGF